MINVSEKTYAWYSSAIVSNMYKDLIPSISDLQDKVDSTILIELPTSAVLHISTLDDPMDYLTKHFPEYCI